MTHCPLFVLLHFLSIWGGIFPGECLHVRWVGQGQSHNLTHQPRPDSGTKMRPPPLSWSSTMTWLSRKCLHLLCKDFLSIFLKLLSFAYSFIPHYEKLSAVLLIRPGFPYDPWNYITPYNRIENDKAFQLKNP